MGFSLYRRISFLVHHAGLNSLGDSFVSFLDLAVLFVFVPLYAKEIALTLNLKCLIIKFIILIWTAATEITTVFVPIVLAIRSCLILLNRDRMQSCAKLQTGGWYRYQCGGFFCVET